ncbi:outer membrane lipoprotein-sorting protein [Paenibacillus athensensis]|nr:DUF4367 domain-containing protein [Paenibacillus athensensis]
MKDSGAVVKDLDHVISKLDSYEGAGRMVLHTGQQPQEYQVEVSYMNPHFYRIALTNAQKDITQIVLRNEEGVFVLTPHLKKSFRFQSDWPENQGQVYLYQSLAKSILADKERQFTTENEAYVFDVAANYQNELLSRQKIWLNKKDLAPQHVEVSDANQNVMVMVDFTKFKFGVKFDKDSFDMERNMTAWDVSTLPTLADVDGVLDGADGQAAKDGGGTAAAGSTKTDTTAGQATASASDSGKMSFGIIEPAYTPKDVVKQDMTDIKLNEDPAVLLRYKGKYNYSLIEVRPQAQTVSFLPGEVVDLGYTLAVLTGDEKKTLSWTYDGVEYRLSTADLPQEEMLKVAMAVQGQSGK